MKSLTSKILFSALSLAVVAPVAFAESAVADGVKTALSESKIGVNFRLRYENVDQTGVAKNADAFTLKSRFTATSGSYQGWSVGTEVDNITAVVDNYNSTANGKAEYPVVADPEATDVNQLFAKYKNNGVTFTAGRQRINHDNQRFVGGVGWRQNEQTYDGYRIEYKANDKLALDYAYIYNVNRIFGPTGAKADLHGSLHLANAVYTINKQNKVSAFAYGLDFDTAASASTNTYGAKYNGNFGKFFVNAAYATQSDAGDNANNFTANYSNLEVGGNIAKIKLLAGIETLGSDNGVGFATPLATLHKFQGFADKFLATPGTGLQDTYFTAVTKVKGVKLVATYHNFTADAGNADYGTEVDLVAAYTVDKNYSFLVKYADYSADTLATDTSKLWLQMVAKF